MTRVPGQPDDLQWDPFDESLKDDPHPVWKRLRDEAPAYYNDEYDFWALSRFEDVERAHRIRRGTARPIPPCWRA